MAYLQAADYPNYGLPAGTTADWDNGRNGIN